MARITITIPDTLHAQVLKLAKKEASSVSYTVSRLVELGFLLVNNKNKNQEDKSADKVDEHCHKLIIQINEIIKELAIKNYNFTPDKIAKITQETLIKFNELKDSQ